MTARHPTTMPSTLGQLCLAPPAAAGLHEIPVVDANDLLVAWGHYLGPARRPFGQQAPAHVQRDWATYLAARTAVHGTETI